MGRDVLNHLVVTLNGLAGVQMRSHWAGAAHAQVARAQITLVGAVADRGVQTNDLGATV